MNNRGGRGQEEGSRWEIELHITLLQGLNYVKFEKCNLTSLQNC